MRTIRYYVLHKETYKIVHACNSQRECYAFMATLENKEAYGIGYKWLSV